MNSIGISARSDWIYVLVSMAKTKLEQLQKLAVSLKQQKKEKDEERMRKAKNVEKMMMSLMMVVPNLMPPVL